MAFSLTESSLHVGSSIVTLSDTGLNASSKTLLLADAGTTAAYLELLAIRIELTTTATVGNRLMAVRVELTTGPDILYAVTIAANSLAASLSRTWQLAPGVDEAITSPQQVQMPQGIYVFAGQQLVIEDSAAVDAAADDMIVHVLARRVRIRNL